MIQMMTTVNDIYTHYMRTTMMTMTIIMYAHDDEDDDDDHEYHIIHNIHDHSNFKILYTTMIRTRMMKFI